MIQLEINMFWVQIYSKLFIALGTTSLEVYEDPRHSLNKSKQKTSIEYNSYVFLCVFSKLILGVGAKESFFGSLDDVL